LISQWATLIEKGSATIHQAPDTAEFAALEKSSTRGNKSFNNFERTSPYGGVQVFVGGSNSEKDGKDGKDETPKPARARNALADSISPVKGFTPLQCNTTGIFEFCHWCVETDGGSADWYDVQEILEKGKVGIDILKRAAVDTAVGHLLLEMLTRSGDDGEPGLSAGYALRLLSTFKRWHKATTGEDL
jgi:hypothetical protein